MACMSCRSKQGGKYQLPIELQQLKLTTKFSEAELKQMRARFYQSFQILIGNNSFYKSTYPKLKMNKIQFRENMGIMGLQNTLFLSDRIFNMIDKDGDGYVSLQIISFNNQNFKIDFRDFVSYWNVIQFGTADEKAEQSYYLIDTKKQGYFTINEFQYFIMSFLQVWSIMTGTSLSLLYYLKMFSR